MIILGVHIYQQNSLLQRPKRLVAFQHGADLHHIEIEQLTLPLHDVVFLFHLPYNYLLFYNLFQVLASRKTTLYRMLTGKFKSTSFYRLQMYRIIGIFFYLSP
jgi:hypothetical protein